MHLGEMWRVFAGLVASDRPSRHKRRTRGREPGVPAIGWNDGVLPKQRYGKTPEDDDNECDWQFCGSFCQRFLGTLWRVLKVLAAEIGQGGGSRDPFGRQADHRANPRPPMAVVALVAKAAEPWGCSEPYTDRTARGDAVHRKSPGPTSDGAKSVVKPLLTERAYSDGEPPSARPCPFASSISNPCPAAMTASPAASGRRP